MSIESVMPSNRLILCGPLLFLLQSFPASGSFLMNRLCASGGQSSGASAPVFPMNIHDCFPLGWTGWISLQSKGLSRVFSNTAVQKHQFFGSQPSLWPNSDHLEMGRLPRWLATLRVSCLITVLARLGKTSWLCDLWRLTSHQFPSLTR